MPLIDLWLGIKFTMYFSDHNPPHFHAEYQGRKALYKIDDCSRIDGSLPPKAEKHVREWHLNNKHLIEDKWSEFND